MLLACALELDRSGSTHKHTGSSAPPKQLEPLAGFFAAAAYRHILLNLLFVPTFCMVGTGPFLAPCCLRGQW